MKSYEQLQDTKITSADVLATARSAGKEIEVKIQKAVKCKTEVEEHDQIVVSKKKVKLEKNI